MTVAKSTSGSQTATPGTEHTLCTITTGGTFQLGVDLDNLAAADDVTLRIKLKIASSSDTSKEVFSASYANDQGNACLAVSPPVPAPYEFVATLQQSTSSTGRVFPWVVYTYG